MSKIVKQRLPELGVGLSFRPEIADQLYGCVGEMDCMEVILDTALSGALEKKFWTLVAAHVPMVGHGVDVSIGSLTELDTRHLRKLAEVARGMKCKWFSDHLAFTHSDDVEIGQLTPLQFTEANADFIARKIRAASEFFDVPFIIENIAYYFQIPGGTLSEIDFIVRILERAQCGMLLDIHNVYANSINHGYDPFEFIDRLPDAAVVELHVAGGAWKGGLYLDSHGHTVVPEVLELVEYAVATKQPRAVILEREKNFPSIEELLSEVRELRSIWRKHHHSSRRVAMAGVAGRQA
jgi:uncharacterized protein (UPF0276 family)